VEKDVYAALKEKNLTATLVSCALYIMTNITASGDVSHGAFVSHVAPEKGVRILTIH
jgi:hypothetical protein